MSSNALQSADKRESALCKAVETVCMAFDVDMSSKNLSEFTAENKSIPILIGCQSGGADSEIIFSSGSLVPDQFQGDGVLIGADDNDVGRSLAQKSIVDDTCHPSASEPNLFVSMVRIEPAQICMVDKPTKRAHRTGSLNSIT